MSSHVPDWVRRPVQKIADALNNPARPAPEVGAPERGAGEPKARVLCVDDNPQVLRLLQLQLGDYDVAAADSADNALALLAAEAPFDVIITDLRMPGVSGPAFLKQAREQYPTTERIILTGSLDPDTMASVPGKDGGEQVILKPWTKAALVDAVSSAILRRAERTR